MGLEEGQVCVMIHSGSRGLGYQVCDDALLSLRNVPAKYGIELPDRQIGLRPGGQPRGAEVHRGHAGGGQFRLGQPAVADVAGAEVFAEVFGRSWEALQMNLVYDVAHNIAKIGGARRSRAATQEGLRASQRGHPGLSRRPSGSADACIAQIGQPVIIPGDMGRASWVLVGQPGSMEQTFGTTCHGAGRVMSRTAALKHAAGRHIEKELEATRRHRAFAE